LQPRILFGDMFTGARMGRPVKHMRSHDPTINSRWTKSSPVLLSLCLLFFLLVRKAVSLR